MVPPVHRGHHRASASGTARHSRATLAAVAAGASVAAAQSMVGGTDGWTAVAASSEQATVLAAADAGLVQSTSPRAIPASTKAAPAALLHHGPTRDSPDLAAMDNDTDVADVQSLTKGVAVGEALAKGARTLDAALSGAAPSIGSLFGGEEFVKPANGVFTSGFVSRWGVTHYGIDLANKIGTPIYAVTDGTVISSGPASGFGLWVRLKHPGGFISVYGHINRSFVHVGQKVKAGQQIAEIGNRGQSTGPHLHFEVWDPSGRKINPIPWLLVRGIKVVGGSRVDPR